MEIKIQTAKGDDWQIIQKLNNQVFVSDKENDDDRNSFYEYFLAGIVELLKLFKLFKFK